MPNELANEHSKAPLDPEFHQRVLDHLPSPVVVVDDEGTVVFANAAMAALGGWPIDEMLGAHILDQVHPDDHGWLTDAFVAIVEDEAAQQFPDTANWLPINVRLIAKDGTTIPLAITGSGGLSDPAVGGVIYDIRPACQETIVNRVLTGLASGVAVRTLLPHAVDLVALPPLEISIALVEHRLNGSDRIIAATDDMLAQVLRDEGDNWPVCPGSEAVRLLVDEMPAAWRTPFAEAGYVDSFLAEVLAPDESTSFRLVGLTRRRHDASQGPIHRMQRARELIGVTVLRSQNDKLLDHDASHDALTKLPNRVGLARGFGELAASNHSSALLFIDIDNFKPVNDLHGHAGGDEVLAIIADRLQNSVRPDDLVARVGGDEFAVLLAIPDGNCERSAEVADRILSRVSEPVRLNGATIELRASIGITSCGKNSSLEDLLDQADKAMYIAKRAGGAQHHQVDSLPTS